MPKSLSDRLQAAGISQSQIAEIAGVRQATVWKVIHGHGASQPVMAVIEALLAEKKGGGK